MDDKYVVPAAAPSKKTAGSNQDLFRLKIFSPFETYFNDTALSLSAENDTGPFDVLAGHTNFLTLLITCTLRVRTPHGESSLPIKHGVLHVRDDNVTVFLNV